ncbi:hypothetical protein RvY_07116 [Ramazzottius varieornatus]|uniref:Uncharacterized protein n=1 Tax=Ramazzottius varieornatus TaxID=947166 RepID=A0A1D1V638_RAMVA|nr:hypothetical protein RvY_07116 [Ramazzottius varieornatus]
MSHGGDRFDDRYDPRPPMERGDLRDRRHDGPYSGHNITHAPPTRAHEYPGPGDIHPAHNESEESHRHRGTHGGSFMYPGGQYARRESELVKFVKGDHTGHEHNHRGSFGGSFMYPGGAYRRRGSSISEWFGYHPGQPQSQPEPRRARGGSFLFPGRRNSSEAGRGHQGERRDSGPKPSGRRGSFLYPGGAPIRRESQSFVDYISGFIPAGVSGWFTGQRGNEGPRH